MVKSNQHVILLSRFLILSTFQRRLLRIKCSSQTLQTSVTSERRWEQICSLSTCQGFETARSRNSHHLAKGQTQISLSHNLHFPLLTFPRHSQMSHHKFVTESMFVKFTGLYFKTWMGLKVMTAAHKQANISRIYLWPKWHVPQPFPSRSVCPSSVFTDTFIISFGYELYEHAVRWFTI